MKVRPGSTSVGFAWGTSKPGRVKVTVSWSVRLRARVKFAVMPTWEGGSHLRLMDGCITQL